MVTNFWMCGGEESGSVSVLGMIKACMLGLYVSFVEQISRSHADLSLN